MDIQVRRIVGYWARQIWPCSSKHSSPSSPRHVFRHRLQVMRAAPNDQSNRPFHRERERERERERKKPFLQCRAHHRCNQSNGPAAHLFYIPNPKRNKGKHAPFAFHTGHTLKASSSVVNVPAYASRTRSLLITQKSGNKLPYLHRHVSINQLTTRNKGDSLVRTARTPVLFGVLGVSVKLAGVAGSCLDWRRVRSINVLACQSIPRNLGEPRVVLDVL